MNLVVRRLRMGSRMLWKLTSAVQNDTTRLGGRVVRGESPPDRLITTAKDIRLPAKGNLAATG